MTNNIKQTPRFLAIELLTRIEKQGTYSNLGLNQILQQKNLTKKDANLLTTLVYGVLQHKLTLEYWLTPFIAKPQKLEPWVKQLLLSALYQMEFLDKIPKRAIFNETIEIAKVKGHGGIRKLVTGILHAIDRQGLPSFDKLAVKQRLSIETSTPLWLVEELWQEVGQEKTTKILLSINQNPLQSVRLNANHAKKEILVQLDKDNLSWQESPVTPQALRIKGGFAPQSEAFKQGLITVQDESAMLAVEALEVKPNDIVLDACAAPGGKTIQIATQLIDGYVVALDIHQHKVGLIEQNARRQGVSNKVKGLKLDARQSNQYFQANKFDKILVDAPCSGLGLLRRKPEIKYAKSLADSQNLHRIQVEILLAVADTLKPGGTLTYSTCTILNTENQSVVTEFLTQRPDFEQIKTKTRYNLKQERTQLGLTIYPDDYMTDGFFIATLRKRK
ncbi:16S rRNA (cytosine(967)-C(5))-methyltransferase RsmB [Ligilactobacillus sp. Marseille-Q7487]|jgi:16S rRNA (cytosine967-C5)-methyltransferase|uniref:16S rRNA (cytosine(967)-C(5))-methyltransferase RsmB n=1 Tax=Ligilactobacillus sp. Marseille-Q7487 TaxID=3022128 RepID=UPI0015B6C5C5|nr:16S rRNA (cytosine(967)-C(5))-methyltransferase RsmB [Ligilactobacillus sp. Marseille-Q7487]